MKGCFWPPFFSLSLKGSNTIHCARAQTARSQAADSQSAGNSAKPFEEIKLAKKLDTPSRSPLKFHRILNFAKCRKKQFQKG